MKEEKKEFTKAEVEVIRFEKNDVISTSGCPTVIRADQIDTETMTEEEGTL